MNASIYHKLYNEMNKNMNQNPCALVILDGWGLNKNASISAIEAANTPIMDDLMNKCPNATLVTYGEDVGLPEGQMGNSEVGHTNIGAGRVVYQELARINKAFREGELMQNETFLAAINHAKSTTKRLHLLGLVSDGGVHSHINHLIGLIDIMRAHTDIDVYIHAFMDGRDTDPKAGAAYLTKVITAIGSSSNIHIATAIGRYYAMDRDKRWERVKLAYDLLVNGVGQSTDDFIASMQAQYNLGITDEFMVAMRSAALGDQASIQANDTVMFYNFRTDRPRQLTEVLHQIDMPDHGMSTLPLYYVTFTEYDQSYKGVHVVFQKDNLSHTLGQVISEAGLTQVRIAETEKYPHVTFFFNGGQEEVFEGEERIMVASPKVATYDLQPEMSAEEITDKLIAHIDAKKPSFICLNYANTDMVGHTGDFDAAVKATETVDACLGRLLKTLNAHHYHTIIIADHGNSDVMVNPDGSPNTAHTTNPVPVVLCGDGVTKDSWNAHDGKLGDIAPTILHLMGLNKPSAMTGDIIFEPISQ
jgi:2,3-bisphosphoglycerate-independent phosphoglycerate mutase